MPTKMYTGECGSQAHFTHLSRSEGLAQCSLTIPPFVKIILWYEDCGCYNGNAIEISHDQTLGSLTMYRCLGLSGYS